MAKTANLTRKGHNLVLSRLTESLVVALIFAIMI
jgi:hypothetical protein